jgi:3,4-dihydroxy 2-butanone 4-phosphate synthase/GTP cyclohydrolase II
MKIIAIKDLVAYRMRTERLVKRELSVSLPTRFGEIEVIAYSQITSGDVHLAIRKGVWQENEAVPVRVHSSSEGAELLELLLQEHNNSFGKALERIAGEGKGLLLMMFHGGREENTLLDKLRHLEKSLKTSELPFRTEMSQRDFGIGAQILRDLGIKRMRLITNSPKKRVGLEGYGLEVVDHIPF